MRRTCVPRRERKRGKPLAARLQPFHAARVLLQPEAGAERQPPHDPDMVLHYETQEAWTPQSPALHSNSFEKIALHVALSASRCASPTLALPGVSSLPAPPARVRQLPAHHRPAPCASPSTPGTGGTCAAAGLHPRHIPTPPVQTQGQQLGFDSLSVCGVMQRTSNEVVFRIPRIVN